MAEKSPLPRQENPSIYPYPNVPPPKFPEAPADSGYRTGMTSKDYFLELCKREAGEFIYKTVEDVAGIYQVRPRAKATEDELRDRDALEDPYGYRDWEAAHPQFIFVDPKHYQYFETALSFTSSGQANGYQRFSGYDARDLKTMRSEVVAAPKSRYGYTWRGIERPHMREHTIVGGELIVLDLQTNEILAVRRGFMRSGDVPNSPTGIWWLTGQICPQDKDRRRLFFTQEFISKVLKPINASK